MSHLKERKDKSCLNCNAVVHGKYCSFCGQENVHPQESLWHLIVHFFNDITHFDGKFFSSVKYVITKPGFLTSEYVRGRRTSYLNPVRFYVFTSFLFFLILFTFSEINFVKIKNTSQPKISFKDSVEMSQIKGVGNFDFTPDEFRDTTGNDPQVLKIVNYKNRAEYDSLKKLGKTTKKWFKKILIDKQFDLQEKYGKDKKRIAAVLKEKVTSVTPQILFLSLPFFALFLKLLYIRRDKYYYVAHVIFTLHFYIFVYIIILLSRFAHSLSDFKYLHWLNLVAFLLAFSPIYYLYKAMINFYEQSRMKTLLKLFIFSIAVLFLFTFFLILVFGLSIYKM